ncbi:MAG: fumarylacetoacetate hydrolase family protein [Ignavibacteria bacterium]|jgi:2-keto-4-pentenoate hydratase/2-oxohepta-3-ene-1,7-dioic acid hydratase in catechol pathway|nr:fumarylacetoacetate hydrolase family protein [Ignavibacteria bacterium]
MFKYLQIQNTAEQFQVNNVYCIGKNYLDHIREMGGNKPDDVPVVFMKPNSSISGNNTSISIPSYNGNKIGKELHYETEIILAIGKYGLNVPEAEAEGYILGYAIGIDLTLRDIQTKAKAKGLPWLTSKGFLTSAPVSQIILKENINEPANMNFTLKINNELRQTGNTSNMIFGIHKLVSYISHIFGLNKGDLIFTGTPEGVGVLMKGDKLTANLNGYVELNAEFNG